jgi:DNA repair exonuclease SbcCD ATPase subunit
MKSIFDIDKLRSNAGKTPNKSLSKTPLGETLGLGPAKNIDGLDQGTKQELLEYSDKIRKELEPVVNDQITELKGDLEQHKKQKIKLQGSVAKITTSKRDALEAMDSLKVVYEEEMYNISNNNTISDKKIKELIGYINLLQDNIEQIANKDVLLENIEELNAAIEFLQQPASDKQTRANALASLKSTADDFMRILTAEVQTKLEIEQADLKECKSTCKNLESAIRDASTYRESLMGTIDTLQEHVRDGNIEELFNDLDKLEETLSNLEMVEEVQPLRTNILAAQKTFLDKHLAELKEIKLYSVKLDKPRDMGDLVNKIQTNLPSLEKIDFSKNTHISQENFIELLEKLHDINPNIKVDLSRTNLSGLIGQGEFNLSDAVGKIRNRSASIATLKSVEPSEKVTKLNITLDNNLSGGNSKHLSKEFVRFKNLKSVDLSQNTIPDIETLRVILTSLDDGIEVTISPEDQIKFGLEEQRFTKSQFAGFKIRKRLVKKTLETWRKRKAKRIMQKAQNGPLNEKQIEDIAKTSEAAGQNPPNLDTHIDKASSEAVLEEDLVKKRDRYATTIQKIFRGHAVRKKAAEKRKEAEEAKKPRGETENMEEAMEEAEKETQTKAAEGSENKATVDRESEDAKIQKRAVMEKSKEKASKKEGKRMPQENLARLRFAVGIAQDDVDRVNEDLKSLSNSLFRRIGLRGKEIDSLYKELDKAVRDLLIAQEELAKAERKMGQAATKLKEKASPVIEEQSTQPRNIKLEQEAAEPMAQVNYPLIAFTQSPFISSQALVPHSAKPNALTIRFAQHLQNIPNLHNMDNLQLTPVIYPGDLQNHEQASTALAHSLKALQEGRSMLVPFSDKTGQVTGAIAIKKENSKTVISYIGDLNSPFVKFMQFFMRSFLRDKPNIIVTYTGSAQLMQGLNVPNMEAAIAQGALAALTYQSSEREARRQNANHAEPLAPQTKPVDVPEPRSSGHPETSQAPQQLRHRNQYTTRPAAPAPLGLTREETATTKAEESEVSRGSGGLKSIYESVAEESVNYYVANKIAQNTPPIDGQDLMEILYNTWMNAMYEPDPSKVQSSDQKQEREKILERTHEKIANNEITPKQTDAGKVKEYTIGTTDAGEELKLRETIKDGKSTFNIDDIIANGGTCSISIPRTPDSTGKVGYDVIEIINGELRTFVMSERGESKLEATQSKKLLQDIKLAKANGVGRQATWPRERSWPVTSIARISK